MADQTPKTKTPPTRRATAPREFTPLLSLETLIEREHIEINQQPYFLRNAQELSLLELTEISQLGVRMQVLGADLELGTLTEAGDKELGTVLDRMVEIGLVAPVEVRTSLHVLQKLALSKVFSELLQRQKPGALMGALAAAPGRSTQGTGAKKSRGSRGSTAFPRGRG